MIKKVLLWCVLLVGSGMLAQRQAPFTETFSNVNTNSSAIPSGWSNTTTSTHAYGFWATSNDNLTNSMSYDGSIARDHSGDNGRFIYIHPTRFQSVGQTATLQTETFDITGLSNPELSLAVFSYNTTYATTSPIANKLIISFFDGTVWHDSITGYQDQSSSVWNEVVVNLSSYIATSTNLDSCVVNIIYKVSGGSTSAFNQHNSIGIDDFSIHEGASCGNLDSLEVANILANSVDISWDVTNTTANSYEVMYWEYFVGGFTQATTTTTVTSSTNSGQLSSLKSNTQYSARVRANCTGGGNSNWTSPITFETACGPITAPYFQDFSTELDRLGSLPSCYSHYSTTPATYTTAVVSTNNIVHSLRLADGRHISDPLFANTDTAMIILPEASDLTAGDKQLSFNLNFNSPSYKAKQVIIGTLASSDPKSTFTPLKTYSNLSAGVLHNLVTPFTSLQGYNGVDTHIAIRVEESQIGFDLFISNVDYDFIPVCTPVTYANLLSTTDSSATFNIDVANPSSKMDVVWVPQGSIIAQPYLVGNAGVFVGNTITVTNSKDTSTVTGGLVPGNAYDLYIRSQCDFGGYFFGPIPFRLPCTSFTAPYFNGFETKPNLESDCWKPYNSGTSSYAMFDISSYVPHSGNSHIRIENRYISTADTIMVISPVFSDMTDGNKQIRFQLYSDNDSIANYYTSPTFRDPEMAGLVVATTSESRVGGLTVLDTLYPSTSAVYEEFIIQLDSLHGYNGTDNQIVFIHDNADDNEGIHIDDFNYELNNCGSVENLSVSVTSDTSASLSWDGGLYNTGYEVWYGPEGFLQGTQTAIGAGTTQFVTGNSLVLDTLSELTCYEYVVRAICASDTSSWTKQLSFCTPCGDALSGTYTIGTSASADFASFGEAGSRLNSCGIDGPVVFNVEPGIYTDTLHLINVQGVSATNTITFNGGGASLVQPSVYTTGTTIYVHNTSFVSISNLRIDNMIQDFVSAVYISNSSHISLDSNSIGLNVLSTGITTYAVDTLNISNNSIDSAYVGILCEGAGSGDFALDVNISNNVITDFFDKGIDIDEIQHLVVDENFMQCYPGASGADGMYAYDVNDFSIRGNTILTEDIGMVVLDGNDNDYNPVVKSGVVNNMIASTGDDGLRIQDVRHVNVYHNTTLGIPGFILNDQEYADVRNNIFTSPSDLAADIDDGIASTDSLDYNIYYRFDQSGSLIDDNGTAYTSLSAWQTANLAINVHSLEGNPGFVSNTDLHILGALPNDVGDTTVVVFSDIDGDVRLASSPLAVDIGADEYAPVYDDLSVEKIIGIEGGVCGDSTQAISVVISNNGLQAQSNFDVTVNTSGAVVSSQTVTYSGTLASAAVDTVFVTNLNTYGGGVFVIEASTQLTGDQVSSNDTLELTVNIMDKSAPLASAVLDTICPGDSTILVFPNDLGNYQWETTNGILLGSTDSLVVGPIASSDSTFILKSLGTYKASDTVGEFTPFFTSGRGQHANRGGLRFKVRGNLTIDSVKVYSVTSGDYAVSVVNNATGLPVYGPDTVSIIGNNMTTPIWIPLSYNLTSGDYSLEQGDALDANYRPYMVYNTQGANYPYIVNNGALEIYESYRKSTNSSAVNSTSEYRFFYDWQVTIHDLCNRPDGEVTVYADTSNTVKAAFTAQVGTSGPTNVTVAFDGSASSGGNSYIWDFGDGNTGTGVKVSHNYTANGTYTVQLVVTGSCSSDTITQTLTIVGMSLEDVFSNTLNIYPNPTKGILTVEFVGDNMDNTSIRILEMSGREVFKKNIQHVNGSYFTTIDLAGFANGMYIVEVNSGNTSVYKRVYKD